MSDDAGFGQSADGQISDEDLVAFLDRELLPEQALRIEQRLAVDAELRKRVEDLNQSWELLDCLPESKPDSKLAETTIELVAMKLLEERKQSLKSRLKRYLVPLLGVATLVALGLGAATASLRQSWEERQLLRTLPLITRYPDLKLIDSTEWLDQLAEIDFLIESGLPLYREPMFPPEPNSADALSVWLDELDPLLRLRLYENFESFQAQTPARQELLRDIGAKLTQPAAVDFASVLKAYSGLISQIGSAELAQIEADSNLEQRASKIRQVINRELAIAYAYRLSEQEKFSIRQWSNEFMEKHFDYFVELDDPDSEIVLLLDLPTEESIIQPEDIMELTSRIDPAGRDLLDQLDERQRLKTLRLWVYTCSPANKPRPNYTAHELREQFNALPLEQQNRLIYQPGSQVIKALTDAGTQTSK